MRIARRLMLSRKRHTLVRHSSYSGKRDKNRLLCERLGAGTSALGVQQQVDARRVSQRAVVTATLTDNNSQPHRDTRLRASATAAPSRESPRAVGIRFPALSMSSVMTWRMRSSDSATPAASKSLRILLKTSLRSGSTVPLARAFE